VRESSSMGELREVLQRGTNVLTLSAQFCKKIPKSDISFVTKFAA
jgi:hypothetical protein